MKSLQDYKCSVIPALRSKPEDQPQEEFHRAVNFLVANYSVTELAGALLNATSGDVYRRIADLAKNVEES